MYAQRSSPSVSVCRCASTRQKDTSLSWNISSDTLSIPLQRSHCSIQTVVYNKYLPFTFSTCVSAFCWRLGAKTFTYKIASMDDKNGGNKICKLKIGLHEQTQNTGMYRCRRYCSENFTPRCAVVEIIPKYCWGQILRTFSTVKLIIDCQTDRRSDEESVGLTHGGRGVQAAAGCDEAWW